MHKKVLIGFGILVLVLAIIVGMKYLTRGKALYEPGKVAEYTTLNPSKNKHSEGHFQIEDFMFLYQLQAGTGEDALVLHDGPCFPEIRAWKSAQTLGEKFKFHYYQMRGCGNSSHPIALAPGKGYTSDMQYVEKVLGFGEQIADIERIRRLLGKEKIVLFGNGMGGLIASLYAAEFPDRVKALVLTAPANLVVTPKKTDDVYQIVRKKLPSTAQTEYDNYMKAYMDYENLINMNENSLAAFYSQFKRYFAVAENVRSLHVASMIDPNISGGFMTLAAQFSMGTRHDYSDFFKRIKAPTLVLHGTEDIIPESDSKEFASYIPNAQTVIINKAGHFPFDENPQEFTLAVNKFFSEVK